MATSVWGTLVRESTWVSGFSGRDCLRGIKRTVGSTFSDWPVQEKSCDHVWQVLCRVNVEKNVFPLHFYDVWYWNICKTSSWEAKNLLTILERVFFFLIISFHYFYFATLFVVDVVYLRLTETLPVSLSEVKEQQQKLQYFSLQWCYKGQCQVSPNLPLSYLSPI